MTEETLIDSVLAGQWHDPDSGRPLHTPIQRIDLADNLEGAEADLVASLNLGKHLAVVCDENTVEVLGRRVAQALEGAFQIDLVVLEKPRAKQPMVDDLCHRTRHADALVAVGAGTVNDLCKFAGFSDGRAYAVFPTAASMNGYTSSTASISREGVKLSLPAQLPQGIFMDLGVLAAAPAYLTRSGLGDCICRSSAQVDCLLAHWLVGQPYYRGPFVLQETDEEPLLDAAAGVDKGDLQALRLLARILTLCGLGVAISGTSHHGSMSEHLVSHYIDMLAGDRHPGSLHGQQVGVASLSMGRMQQIILDSEEPPRLHPTRVDEGAMYRRYGEMTAHMLAEFRAKALDANAAARLNDQLTANWADYRSQMRAVMLPVQRLEQALMAANAPRTPGDLGLDDRFYREALCHAREIRNRFSILDVAGDAGWLEDFATREVGHG